jgi:transketolase N-terminal domain/subunit
MNEDIKTMFSRFQTSVSGVQVLNKSYTTKYHVKKIMRIVLVRCRPKMTVIQETKDLNKLGLETVISSLKSHDMELLGNDPSTKSKFIALKSKGKTIKALQAVESEEYIPKEDLEEGSDEDEMAFDLRGFNTRTRIKGFMEEAWLYR